MLVADVNSCHATKNYVTYVPYVVNHYFDTGPLPRFRRFLELKKTIIDFFFICASWHAFRSNHSEQMLQPMTRSILILSIALISFACNGDDSSSEKDTSGASGTENATGANGSGDAQTHDPGRTNDGQVPPQNDDDARLVVSFISEGEGIDHTLKADFDKWLTKNQNVTWETTPWGREGEVDYCFRLSNMQTGEQEVFVQEVRAFLKDKKLVLVSEWTPCDQRK